ncbi:MAG: XRE family transcriptional regulator, partial [Peptococcaceae bacterium]|nr:XRE family transcriptional regulator [Peptococcaceae bacterium]
LSDELYGAINSNLWSACITEEQAAYLRGKYLYGTEASGDD